jgi:hypothetical protein
MRGILPVHILLILLLFYGAVIASGFADVAMINAEIAYPTSVSNLTAELEKKMGFNGSATGTILANTDLLPNLWFVPTGTVSYYSTAQPIQVDDRRFLFSQWFDAYANAGLNYDITGSWTLKGRVFARKDLTQLSNEEVFGKGLYDFMDLGFYAENSLKFDRFMLDFGIKYTDKKFPNYTSLSGAVTGNSGEPLISAPDREKDDLIYNCYADACMKCGDSGMQTLVSAGYSYIPYLEQRVVTTDGTLGDSRRIDKMVVISVDVPYYADKVSFLSVGYAMNLLISNQGFYDTFGDIDPSNDLYSVNYYTGTENIFKARLAYEPGFEMINKKKPVAEFGLEFSTLKYENRDAKDVSGNYTQDREVDDNYTLSFNLKQDICDFVGMYFDLKYARYESNMKWETFGAYNYTMLTIAMGTNINF